MINQVDENGQEHGLWEYYQFNGALKWKGELKNRKRVGLWEYYHVTGKLAYKGECKNGKNRGLWYEE